MALLEVKNLCTEFKTDQGRVQAVRGVSFELGEKEVLGIVGESGSGKSQTMYSIIGLLAENGQISNGEVIFDTGEQYDENGKIIVDANGKPILGEKINHKMLPYRKEMQMVFQDPYSSLNPRMTVEDIIGEPLDVHQLYKTKAERREKILELMELALGGKG